MVVNRVKKRFRRDSASSEESDSSQAEGSRTNYFCLSEKIPLSGGFSSLVTVNGEFPRVIYGFQVKVLNSKEREIVIRTFLAKLYNLHGDCATEIDRILTSLSPPACSSSSSSSRC